MGAECATIADAVRFEEPPAQNLGHVLLADRQDPFLALPAEYVEQSRNQELPQIPPLLVGVGGQQRRHDRRPIHLGHRLDQVLEEVGDAVAPHRIHARLLAGVHEHFVDQDQRGKALPLRLFDQFHQQRLGRRRLALLVAAGAVNGAQPCSARKLEGQHAPRMAQRAGLPVWSADSGNAPLDVDLVEAERYRKRPWKLSADMLPELPHRRQIRQRRRIAEQVIERDQRVRLAAAVGQLKLPHRLVAMPGQPPSDVLHQLAQRVRRIGEREELLRFFVDRTPALRQRDLVQVCCKLGKRQLAAAQFLFQTHHLMPGLEAGLPGHSRTPTGNQVRRVCASSTNAGS